MSGAVLLSELDWSYLDATRRFTGCSGTGEYLERRDVAIASCGLPIESFNRGFLKPPYEDVASAAGFVRAFFEARKLPFRVGVCGAHAALAGGRELGCATAALQASDAGRPVYERMGFSHAPPYLHYLPPEV